MKTWSSVVFFLALVLILGNSTHAAVPNAINYQGRAVDASGLVNASTTIVFRLYNQNIGGLPHYVETQTVTIVDGLYTVKIGGAGGWDLPSVLTNDEVWLEIDLAGQKLSPREELVSVAYALMADSVDINAIKTEMLANGAVTSNKLGVGSVTSGVIKDGDIQFADMSQNGAVSGDIMIWDGSKWATGTVENALLSYDENGTFTPRPQALDVGAIAQGTGARAGGQESVVGGGFSNTIAAGASQATISGGRLNTIGLNAWRATIGGGQQNVIDVGSESALIAGGNQNTIESTVIAGAIGGGAHNRIGDSANQAVISGGWSNVIEQAAEWATIGGGLLNSIGEASEDATIAGGWNNQIGAYAWDAAIGGGSFNRVACNADKSVIAGGDGNYIGTNSSHSTIGGGRHNQIEKDATYATIGGGHTNIASGLWSTIPGGYGNVAEGYFSFAAGSDAQALHHNTFVWGDGSQSPFQSMDQNQFLILATNGVGINTNSPKATLHVNGDAVIGAMSGAPRFGMVAVSRGSSGDLFQHPSGDFKLTWDGTSRILTVTNTSALSDFDTEMYLVGDVDVSGTTGLGLARDIRYPGIVPAESFLSVTNTTGSAAGWRVTSIKENASGPGFIFNGSGYSSTIQGLVTYWH